MVGPQTINGLLTSSLLGVSLLIWESCHPSARVANKGMATFGGMDYSKSWAFLRKLAYKSLHLYGSGMTNIEDIVIDDVDRMCSIISGELGKPVAIQQYLGKDFEY